MKIHFMAGEMAKLHNISKQTLIYYDKIGLFRPAETDDETGYRYYALQQCQDLDVIICLKKFDMSLKEIKDYLQMMTTAERINLLENREDMMRKKIEKIYRAKKRLKNTISSLKTRMDIVPFELGLKREKKRYMVSQQVDPPFDEYQLEVAIKQLFRSNSKRDDTGIHELLVRVESIRQDDVKFKTVALQVESKTDEFLTESDYAFIVHKGPFVSMNVSRNKLMAFIEASDYVALDCAYIEKILFDALAVPDHSKYLVEIQIPVVKKE
ncbi:MAG: MerR family transcriptional regulator [Desulfobulbaceae bacterium]|nr:MerR family transcriptional regulator [Desulfobulbaceae bacterium]